MISVLGSWPGSELVLLALDAASSLIGCGWSTSALQAEEVAGTLCRSNHVNRQACTRIAL